MDEAEAPFAGDDTQVAGEILAGLNDSNHSIKTEPAEDSSQASEFDALFSRLSSENPQDPEGWRRLISLATASREIPKIQQAYDELLKHYPNTVRSLSIPYCTQNFVGREK